MTVKEVKAAISDQLTVPLWPHTGIALGMSRNPVYDAAKSGEIPTIKIGRSIRVPTAALRKMLALSEPQQLGSKVAA